MYLSVLGSLVFFGLIGANNFYFLEQSAKGESLTVNATQEKFLETSFIIEDKTPYSVPAHMPDSSNKCPPALYFQKKREKTPLDGPFTHEKSDSASNWPHKMVGKIIFTRSSGEMATCSGAVIQKRLVVTAGHCAYKNGNYMSDFYFIPAFDDGIAPFGVWTFKSVWVSPSWYQNTTVPNEGDWSLFVVDDQFVNGKEVSIGDCLGWFGFTINNLKDNHVTSLGYADNFDEGKKMHQVYSQYRRTRKYGVVEYPSDMTEGTSGGPWVENFDGVENNQNKIVGITSYRDSDPSRKYLGSSVLNSKFVELVKKACEAPGNCVPPSNNLQ